MIYKGRGHFSKAFSQARVLRGREFLEVNIHLLHLLFLISVIPTNRNSHSPAQAPQNGSVQQKNFISALGSCLSHNHLLVLSVLQ